MRQLRNPWLIVPLILAGNILLTCFHLWLSGELKSWAQLPDALNHASFSATMTTIGWIFFRSPWAAQIIEIMGEQKSTGPAGETVQSTKVTLSNEPPAGGNS
jgi:hypothetical protein